MFYGEALDGFVFAGAGLIICGVVVEPVCRIAAVAGAIAASTEMAQSVECRRVIRRFGNALKLLWTPFGGVKV